VLVAVVDEPEVVDAFVRLGVAAVELLADDCEVTMVVCEFTAR
jgi:hypothetical protein